MYFLFIGSDDENLENIKKYIKFLKETKRFSDQSDAYKTFMRKTQTAQNGFLCAALDPIKEGAQKELSASLSKHIQQSHIVIIVVHPEHALDPKLLEQYKNLVEQIQEHNSEARIHMFVHAVYSVDGKVPLDYEKTVRFNLSNFSAYRSQAVLTFHTPDLSDYQSVLQELSIVVELDNTDVEQYMIIINMLKSLLTTDAGELKNLDEINVDDCTSMIHMFNEEQTEFFLKQMALANFIEKSPSIVGFFAPMQQKSVIGMLKEVATKHIDTFEHGKPLAYKKNRLS